MSVATVEEERVADEAIRFLLYGLGVASIAELKGLVDLARFSYGTISVDGGDNANAIHRPA